MSECNQNLLSRGRDAEHDRAKPNQRGEEIVNFNLVYSCDKVSCKTSENIHAQEAQHEERELKAQVVQLANLNEALQNKLTAVVQEKEEMRRRLASSDTAAESAHMVAHVCDKARKKLRKSAAELQKLQTEARRLAAERDDWRFTADKLEIELRETRRRYEYQLSNASFTTFSDSLTSSHGDERESDTEKIVRELEETRHRNEELTDAYRVKEREFMEFMNNSTQDAAKVALEKNEEIRKLLAQVQSLCLERNYLHQKLNDLHQCVQGRKGRVDSTDKFATKEEFRRDSPEVCNQISELLGWRKAHPMDDCNHSPTGRMDHHTTRPQRNQFAHDRLWSSERIPCSSKATRQQLQGPVVGFPDKRRLGFWRFWSSDRAVRPPKQGGLPARTRLRRSVSAPDLSESAEGSYPGNGEGPRPLSGEVGNFPCFPRLQLNRHVDYASKDDQRGTMIPFVKKVNPVTYSDLVGMGKGRAPLQTANISGDNSYGNNTPKVTDTQQDNVGGSSFEDADHLKGTETLDSANNQAITLLRSASHEDLQCLSCTIPGNLPRPKRRASAA